MRGVMCTKKSIAIVLGVIFNCSVNASSFQITVPGSWNPSQEQIDDAMEKLKSGLIDLASKRNSNLYPWEDYRIQFAGVWEHQRQYIHFISICSDLWEETSFWKERWVPLNEDFPCYFQGTYDVEAKSIQMHAN